MTIRTRAFPRWFASCAFNCETGSGFVALQKPSLAARRFFARLPLPASEAAIRLHNASSNFVLQILRQDLVPEAANQGSIFYGKKNLYAPVQVARHQVGASEINALITAV